MITASTVEEMSLKLEKARKKALQVNPAFEIVETGLYRVQSSKGGWYDVRAGRNEAGELFIACGCRGGLEGLPCYHGAKVFFVHTKIKTLEIQKQNLNEQKNAPYFQKTLNESKSEIIGKVRI